MVDFFHAAEQLKAATDAAYGENNTRGRAQYEKYRHVLRHELGGVERVIRGLRYLRCKYLPQADQGSVGLLLSQPAADGLRGSGRARAADRVWGGRGRV